MNALALARHRPRRRPDTPPVSIVIPAFNEERSILKSPRHPELWWENYLRFGLGLRWFPAGRSAAGSGG